MARSVKQGLNYFPFDVNFFSDIKVRKLIKYQGCKATPVYTLLLCTIYKNGYYLRWDNELPFTISEITGYEEGYVNEVINCCLKVGLFDEEIFKNCQHLTSKGIQERYQEICKQLKRKSIISHFNLISSEETAKSSETIVENSEEVPQRKGKENKVKEIKGKEIALTIEFLKDHFNSDFNFKICRDHGISPEKNLQMQDVFFKEIDRKEKNFDYESPRECRAHYDSWLKIQLEKEKNSAKKENEPMTQAKNID